MALFKGGNGADTLVGTVDHDTLYGGNNNDSLAGIAGNDTLFGENGSDTLDGGDGIDRIEGGRGTDLIYGGSGDDNLTGGDDGDTIFAGDGEDRVYPGFGNDLVLLEHDLMDDVVRGTIAELSGDTVLGFDVGFRNDALQVLGAPATLGRFLDNLAVIDGLVNLSKAGGGLVHLDDTISGFTDTMLGSDGGIFVYVV
ncbi:MAG: calcium-binding protein [Alphaproteobacteria bacterium]